MSKKSNVNEYRTIDSDAVPNGKRRGKLYWALSPPRGLLMQMRS